MQALLDTLDWPWVVEQLAQQCQTPFGKQHALSPDLLSKDFESIQVLLSHTDETKRLLLRYGDIDLDRHTDIRGTLLRLAKQGQFHSPQEIAEVLQTLKQLRRLGRFFIQHRSKEETPTLGERIDLIQLPNPIIEYLETMVSDYGDFLESASPRYASLKRQIMETRQTVKDQLNRMIHRPPMNKYLQESIITEREGRYVLPVKAEHKSDVPGIVHGTSGSGITFYIEPSTIVDLNNRLSTYRSELAQEVDRLLRVVSERMVPETDALLDFLNDMGYFDFTLAKARLSRQWDANPVTLVAEPGVIELRQARHPILLSQGIDVVPNDITLAPPHRVMVITGPNTGGKTVLLKLAGLCALLLQAGMHLPVAENCRMSLFHPVLADIGDAQSISQNLSTFSGHMTHMNEFLNDPDLWRALVLIDEICAGTDPEEGSALAQALLNAFEQAGATTIVTTHLGNLKVIAYQHPNYVNASVEFDAQSLRPTYRLMIGIPGISHALNIAQQLGLSTAIIDHAKSCLSQPASDTAELITSLESSNVQMSQALKETRRIQETLETKEARLQEDIIRLENDKRKSLQMFRESLKDKLGSIERELDELKQTLRQSKFKNPKDIDGLAKRFKSLHHASANIFYEESQALYTTPELDWDSLKVGDHVQSRSLNLTGTIVEKNEHKQELTLQAGMLKSTVPLSDIVRLISNRESKKNKRQTETAAAPVYRGNRRYSESCDLRGMMVEEALETLERFIDDALLNETERVDVIHGQGTGALKKAVRQYLKTLNVVKQFYPASAMEGGDGKTIVEFR